MKRLVGKGRPLGGPAIRATLVRAVAGAVLSGVIVSAVLIGGGAPAALAAPQIAPTTIPAAPPCVDPPALSASAAILIDADSGEILYSKEPDARLPMASTTKIMTAILVLESLELDQKVTVPKHVTGTAGSVAGLQWGEVLTVEELLYTLMIPSGNDTAIVLAEETAGSVQAFVQRMNDKAQVLGLTNTHFSNPNGLHLDDHYSSARDLATMAQYAMRNAVFRRIVDTPRYKLPFPGDDSYDREFKNGNALLSKYEWVTGIKTGSTPYAGYCMVASATYDGISLIAVLLGAENDDIRWAETEALLKYGLTVYPRTVLADKGELVAVLDVSDPLGRKVRLVADKAFVLRLSAGDVVTRTAELTSDLSLPVDVGEVLGTLAFFRDGMPLGSVRLVAAQAVQRIPLAELMMHLKYDRSHALQDLD